MCDKIDRSISALIAHGIHRPTHVTYVLDVRTFVRRPQNGIQAISLAHTNKFPENVPHHCIRHLMSFICVEFSPTQFELGTVLSYLDCIT
jgi:hypothetical protein